MNQESFTHSTSLSEDKIIGYKNIKTPFSDFGRFEDPEVSNRTTSKKRFIDGIDYVPAYNYPKLTFLKDDKTVSEKKTAVYEAVLELETAQKAAAIIGDTPRSAELLLYRSFHDVRLKKIMLVEAANHMQDVRSSSEQETARQTFMQMNTEVYGAMREDIFRTMIGAERTKVESFEANDETAKTISEDLRRVLFAMGIEASHDVELMSDKEINTLHEVVVRRYSTILSAIPETGDDVYYDAQQCADIINDTLIAGGLYDEGWKCVVNPAKSNPSTDGTKKTISLPVNTRRNAAELKRLVLHEQEVHARRANNGGKVGSNLLATGTADYADVEEGLGVLFECAVAGSLSNPSFNRARERYITAGLALGLDGDAPRDAREVYEILWRILAVNMSSDGKMPVDLVDEAKNKAFLHIENAFRGTAFWMKGVIYTKLKIYYEGFMANAQYVRNNIGRLDDAIDEAMTGKFNHTSPQEAALVRTIKNGK